MDGAHCRGPEGKFVPVPQCTGRMPKVKKGKAPAKKKKAPAKKKKAPAKKKKAPAKKK